MLVELRVRDVALIEEAWLEFGPGMTVLTGETGAGKTALVGAIKLLIGERADSTVVRAGSDGAHVEGLVRGDAGEIVVSRRLSADGRSRCSLDGELASVGTLAQRIGPLFDLHGQHDHQALLLPARHAGYLDRALGTPMAEAVESYRASYDEYVAARAVLDELDERLADDRRRADYLRFVAEEIARADPSLDEDTELEARLPGLRHGERLTAAAAEAYAALRDDEAASDAVSIAQASLARAAGLDPALDRLAERLAEVATLLDDVGADVRAYAESIEHDPQALNVVEARLAALGELKKKYGPSLADTFATRDDALARLEALESGESGRSKAEARVTSAKDALRREGKRVSALRSEGVLGFAEELATRTGELGMEGSRFEVALEDLPFERWGREGPQRVEFLYSPGPGQPPRPLAKIGSGGEISRVMLAIKGVLGEADDVPILVFDEVDAGVGGETAHRVGRALAKSAENHQVLVVTHLAQVAAFADAHLVVEKESGEGSVRTRVRRVEGDERVREIARMLGDTDALTAVAHAEELLRAGSSAGKTRA